MKANTSPTPVLVPRRVERMSAEEFLVLVDSDRLNIAKSRFVPPKLGSKDFGRFEVQYKVPVLKPA
ncbi:hypothetical protein [Paracidovorax konjaci]|nr:hypothetical protein [Paracidovorax konjaci]